MLTEFLKYLMSLDSTGPIENGRAMLVPTGMEIKRTEHLRDLRDRFTGRFSTLSMQSFVDYVQAQPEFACFVDQTKMSARAFFNMGTIEAPGHCDNQAQLTLQPTAAFVALSKMANGPPRLSQSQLAEWIENFPDNIRCCAEDDDGDFVTIDSRKATRAIRNMKIDSKGEKERTVEDRRTERSDLEAIEVRADDNLPEVLEFKCVPYEPLSEVTFRLRIAVLTGKDDIAFVLRPVGFESALEAIALDFVASLKWRIGSTSPLLIGTFVTGTGRYANSDD